MIADTDFTNY